MADEVLAHYSGKRGAEKLRKEAESIANGKGSLLDKAGAISALERVKEALTRFWKATADLLHIHFTTTEEVADKVLVDLLNGVNPNEVAREYRRKQKQLERINETNPMLDNYHVGIRGLSDILTMREAIEEARQEAEEGDYETLSAYPDITNEMLENALQSGKITVYSSKPIKDGNFVTPSRMQAEDYAGDGRVYSKTVSIDDVAWINTDEGQFVKNRKDKAEKAPLRFKFIGEQGAETLDKAEQAIEFHSLIDEMFDNSNFDKSIHLRERYDLGKTPLWMKHIGIIGDNFSLSFKNIKTHKGKDADHNLTREEWHNLPNALKNPFAITRYKGAKDRFRLYVDIKHNDKYIAVGVDVKRINAGRYKPMLSINSIKTLFAHHGEIGGSEELVTYDEKITLEQQALLRGLNFHEYPTIQELSTTKILQNFGNPKLSDENFSEEDDVLYRPREEAPPQNTGIGYKVFVLKKGKLYPPKVANPNGEDTPVGIWLDADAAPIAGHTVTGRSQVKGGGKGTDGGSLKLAYRPGWHLGVIPYALQFNRIDENGDKTLFPANFVWAEVEYANDVDYQEEAMSYGYTKNGKFQHSYAGLPRVPVNGAYTYRTNPNPETDPWIITGAMRVKRLLTPSEVDKMVKEAGREPQKRQSNAITDAEVVELNKKMGLSSPTAIADSVRSLAERLHLGNVEIVTDASALSGKEAKAKGFYTKSTGKITIVVPNNISAEDAVQTLLHEAVAHYGMGKIMVVLNVNKCLFIIVFLCALLYFINSNTFLFTFLSISKQKYLNFEKI